MIIKKIPVRATFGSMTDKLRTAVDNQLSDELNNPATLVDKLNVPFSETAPAVTCEPVEGHPLSVVSHIEPIQEGSGDPSPGGWVEAKNASMRFSVAEDAVVISTESGKRYRLVFDVYNEQGERIKMSPKNQLFRYYDWTMMDPLSDWNVDDYYIEFDGSSDYEILTYPFLQDVDFHDYIPSDLSGLVLMELTPANIRPITGHSSVKLRHCGKNLFNPSMISKEVCTYDEATGLWTTIPYDSAMGWHRSILSGENGWDYSRDVGKLIKVPPNTDITISVYDWSANIIVEDDDEYVKPYYMTLTFHSSDGSYIRGGGSIDRDTITVKTPDVEECYLDIKRIVGYVSVSFSNIQVEIGDTPTAYEPYRGEEITIDLGQDVYGGSLDWKSGVLTIDRAIHTLDGSENWYAVDSSSSYDGIDSRKRYALDIAINAFLSNAMFTNNSSTVDSKLLCSKLPTLSCSTVWYNTDGICGIYSANTKSIFAYCEAYATDFEGFKEMMKGAQIVFGLKEPITVQLTPQEILALSGTNTIYSDTGDTTVSGKADPSAVIEKLTNAIIALGGNV